MPLQYDDIPGSWGTYSEAWPSLHDPDDKVRRLVIKNGLVPYGSYVTVGDELRLETYAYINVVNAALKVEHDKSTD